MVVEGQGNNGQGTDYTPDPNLPDQSDQIMEAFGLSGDWDAAIHAATERLDNPGGGEGVAPASPPSSAEGGGEGGPSNQSQTPPASDQQGEGASQTQAQPPAPPAPAVAPAPPPAPAPAPPESNPLVSQLQAQVQALTQHIESMRAQQQTSATAAPPAPPAPAAEELSSYRLAVPDNILGAVISDDPQQAAQGIHQLVNSLAATVHTRVMQHVDQLLGSRLSEYDQQQRVGSEQQRMQREYFEAFPQHGDAATRIIVQQEAQALWAANPALHWDEDTRNSLGQRVNARLGIVPQQAAPQPIVASATPAPAAIPRPAAQMGATTRPVHATTPGDEITAILAG